MCTDEYAVALCHGQGWIQWGEELWHPEIVGFPIASNGVKKLMAWRIIGMRWPTKVQLWIHPWW